jgi:predicted nucleic acid-binding protein
MAVTTFLDTSVLVAGLIDFGPQSAPAQSIMHAVAEKTLPATGTSWHCCLEFYSVTTRLPPEYRLSPADASRLVEEEVLARLEVDDLPAADRQAFFRAAARDATAGGRVYDVHIAEVARAAGARIVVTDNRRHFMAALRHGLRVETPGEFVAAMKKSQRN